MPLEYEWVRDGCPSPEPPQPPAGPTLSPGSISACIVVRHEAALIGRCLDSVEGVVDEILVLHDGPCEDQTLEIAKGRGCRVFVRPRYGGCEHHLPSAYAEARGEWLLTLDADEFLSDPLRAALRGLTADPNVDGYEFLWKLWDGRRYFSDDGPFKLALVRRRAMRMVGIAHSKGDVDGVVRRVNLLLEHRPAYDNFSRRTILEKWGPRARLQALEYLADLNTLPKFNYPGILRWTKRRQRMNQWAWLMVVPAALHTLLFVVTDLKGQMGLRERVKFALTQGLYRGMVTASIARERWRRPTT